MIQAFVVCSPGQRTEANGHCTSPSTTPSERTTAAAVSSQLVSMPSTVKGFDTSGRPESAGAAQPGSAPTDDVGGSRASSPLFCEDDPARRTLLALTVYKKKKKGEINADREKKTERHVKIMQLGVADDQVLDVLIFWIDLID